MKNMSLFLLVGVIFITSMVYTYSRYTILGAGGKVKKLNKKYVISLFATKPKKPKNHKKVVVIGAGYAGLMAAHELMYAGYDVQVLEANQRVGGRVLSASTHSNTWSYLNTSTEEFIEYGGELFGKSHLLAQKMKTVMGLNYDLPRKGRKQRIIEEAEYKFYFVDHLNETHVNSESLIGAFLAFDEKMVDDSKKTFFPDSIYPYEANDKEEKWTWMKYWDQRTLAEELHDWIELQGGSAEEKELTFQFINSIYRAHNGAPTELQSYLFQILTVKQGSGEAVEYYRIKEGNQELARRFQVNLNAEEGCSVDLGQVVEKIDSNSQNTVSIHVKDQATPIVADYVVVAVPPTLMGSQGANNIIFDPILKVRDENGTATDFLMADIIQMGDVIKYILKTKESFIKNTDVVTVYTGSFYDTIPHIPREPTDAGICMVYSYPIQPNPGQTMEQTFDSEIARILNLPEDFKYTADGSSGSVIKKWTENPYSKGGFSAPQKGLITSNKGDLLINGEEGCLNSPRIIFGGEATAFGYSGYMEGALVSGARSAQIIYKRDT